MYAIIQCKNIDTISLIHSLCEFRKHTGKKTNNWQILKNSAI